MLKKLALLAALLVLGTSFPALAQVGAVPKVYLSTASTNCTLIVAGGHTITLMVPINTTTTTYYLKLFDTPVTPVAGTDVPVQNYPVPWGANNSVGGISIPIGSGIAFRSGVGFCLTGGIAQNDNSNADVGVTLNFGIQ